MVFSILKSAHRLIILAPLLTSYAVARCHMFYLMCKNLSRTNCLDLEKAKGNLLLLCDHLYDAAESHLM